MYCLLFTFLTYFTYESTAFSEEAFSYEYEESNVNISYDLKPKLIIFDTDKTIWPFSVSDLQFPFNKNENGTVVDAAGYHLKPFNNVSQLFEELQKEGYVLGFAADSHCCEYTWKVFELLELNSYIKYRACYEGSKEKLIKVIHEQSGVNYEDMLFLTHDWQGIREVGLLRTVIILSDEEKGVTFDDVKRGLHIFKRRVSVSHIKNNSTNRRVEMFLNFK